ncbi:MAG: hypothetical protein AB1540_14435 [Bdellovibrionota bacterium]
MTSSRKDSVSLALTGLRRGKGEIVKADSPDQFEKKLIRLAHAKLRSQQFKEEQLRRVEQFLISFETPFQQTLEKIKSGEFTSEHEHMLNGLHEKIFDKTVRKAEELTHGLISIEERLEYELRVHDRIFKALEAARKRVFGNKLSSLSPEQGELLRSLYTSDLPLSITARFAQIGDRYEDIIDSHKRFREEENSYRKKELSVRWARSNEEKLSLEAELKETKTKFLQAKRAFELELHIYDPSVLPLLDRYHALNAAIDQDDPESDKKYSILHKMREKIRSKRRLLGKVDAKKKAINKAILRHSFESLLASSSSLYAFTRALGKILDLDPELINKNAVRILEAYPMVAARELAKADLKKDSFKIGTLAQEWLSYNSPTTLHILAEARKQNPDKVKKIIGQYVDVLIEHAPDAKSLGLVFHQVGAPERAEGDPFFIHGDGRVGIAYSQELAEDVFDERRTSKLMKKLEALAIADLSSLARGERNDAAFKMLSDVVESYARKIRGLKSAGFISKKIEADLDLNRSIAKIFNEGVEAVKRMGKQTINNSQARALLLARVPEFRVFFDPYRTVSNDEIVKTIREVARIPESRTLFKGFVSYYDAPTFFDDIENQSGKAIFFEFIHEADSVLEFDTLYVHDRASAIHEKHDFFTLGKQYSDWASRNRLDNAKMSFNVLNPAIRDLDDRDLPKAKTFEQDAHDLFEDRFNYWLKKFSRQPYQERIENTWYHLLKEVTWSKQGNGADIAVLESAIERRTPQGARERLAFFNGHVRAMERLAEEKGGKISYWSKREVDAVSVRSVIRSDQISDISDASLLIDTHENLMKVESSSPLTDRLFEEIWKHRNVKEVKEILLDPKFVGRLYYDENRKLLALWQLEEKFDLAARGKALRSGRMNSPRNGIIRKSTERVKEYIDAQFPEKSGLKNQMIDYVEKTILTNSSETQILSTSKLTTDNWYESRRLAAVDLPQVVNKELNDYQRVKWVQYLIGASEEIPQFQVPFDLERKYASKEELAMAARRSFHEADIFTRTYSLQPLLDEKHGLLSNPVLSERIFDTILGGHANDKLYRKAFFAYMNALDPTEKKAVLGYILGSMAEGSKKGASVKTVLEAMGVFGIKAGQFLRTSGLVSEKLKAELDHFFDKALEPNRQEIDQRLKEVFGENLGPVRRVRELSGSGSVNYVVVADVFRPGTAKPKRVVIRFRREGIEGQVFNENANWTRAITTLTTDQDSDVRKMGRVIEETRAHAMETLKPGGIELDLEIEVNAYGDASAAYGRPKHAKTRFRIEVAKPLPELLEAIPAKYRKTVSIYEAVNHVPLSEIKSRKLRAQAASEIVEAEFEALFNKGVFDPDGHPGNWLIDLENGRLVRIDYAQLRKPPTNEIQAFKKMLSELLYPDLEKRSGAVAAQFSALIDISAEVGDITPRIARILNDPKMPDFRNPHERFFFIRERLEDLLQAEGFEKAEVRFKDSARAALSSLARTQIYREHMGDSAYVDLLLEKLGISPVRYKTAIFSKSSFRSVSNFIGRCIGNTVGKLEVFGKK